jgi:hypothetical protein
MQRDGKYITRVDREKEYQSKTENTVTEEKSKLKEMIKVKYI